MKPSALQNLKTLKMFSLLASFIFSFGLFSISAIAEDIDIIVLEQDESNEITIDEENGSSVLYFGDSLANFLAWDEDLDAFVFSDNIDFGGNEVINFRLENLAIAPDCNAASIGRAYFNTTTKYSYECNGTQWHILDNDGESSPVTLPFVYSLSPNVVFPDTQNTITLTGINFVPSTMFDFGDGATLDSLEIVNGNTAIAKVTAGSIEKVVAVRAENRNESWIGNTLNLTISSVLTAEEITNNFTENSSAISKWVPDLHAIRFDNGLSGNRIIDGGDDMYDTGNVLNTNRKTRLSYTDGSIVVDEDAFGIGGEYMTDVQSNIFFMLASLGDGITEFYIDGGLGADGQGSVDAFEINYNGYTAYIKRVYGAGSDPSVNHIMLVKDSATLTHEWSTNTDKDFHKISGLETALSENDNGDLEGNLYYFLFAAGQGGLIDNTDMQNIVSYITDNILQ